LNAAISKTRKRRLEIEAIDDYTVNNYSIDSIKEDLETIDKEEQQKLLNKIIKQLSDDDYLIIKLFYLKELPVADISQITGLSEANVKVKLHRIRKKMYHQMQIEIQHFDKNSINL
jgi:RNA polymerase sigma-70 factor (ECF subfamily)